MEGWGVVKARGGGWIHPLGFEILLTKINQPYKCPEIFLLLLIATKVSILGFFHPNEYNYAWMPDNALYKLQMHDFEIYFRLV